jgi:hypothetical protein
MASVFAHPAYRKKALGGLASGREEGEAAETAEVGAIGGEGCVRGPAKDASTSRSGAGPAGNMAPGSGRAVVQLRAGHVAQICLIAARVAASGEATGVGGADMPAFAPRILATSRATG